MGFHLEVYAPHHYTASLDIDDEQCRRDDHSQNPAAKSDPTSHVRSTEMYS